MIDDTALPKQGTHSVGVARQLLRWLGKKANCQSLVSLTLARDEVPRPLGLRLFLPEEWASDPARCARAGVPEAARASRSKGEIALSELDRLREVGVRFGTVLADAGYGSSAAFRHALVERGLRFAVGILCTQKVYAADVALVPPAGRARKLVPDQDLRTVEAVTDERPGGALRGAKAPRASVGPLLGPAGAGRRWAWLRQQPVICGRGGLAGGRCGPLSGERKYYLSNLAGADHATGTRRRR